MKTDGRMISIINRSTPLLKSMSRQMSSSSSASSPFLPSAMVPLTEDVGKIEKRSSAVGRSSGPLVGIPDMML